MLKLPIILLAGFGALVVVPIVCAVGAVLVGVVTGVGVGLGVGIGVPLFVGLGAILVILVKFAGPLLLLLGILYLIRRG